MVSINIGRKEAIFFGAIILVLAVVGLGVAYGGSSPSTMGHSAGELQGVCLSDGTNCPASMTNPSIITGTGDTITLPGGSYTVLIWASYSVSPEGRIVYLKLDGTTIDSKISWDGDNPSGIGTPTMMVITKIQDTTSHKLTLTAADSDLYAKEYMWLAIKD